MLRTSNCHIQQHCCYVQYNLNDRKYSIPWYEAHILYLAHVACACDDYGCLLLLRHLTDHLSWLAGRRSQHSGQLQQ